MARYQETKNYIWCTNDRLGAGATAVVYKGIDKRTGQLVAIKSFFKNHEAREIRVLQTINHKNIVKLLGIEEVSDGSKVIIMELCLGNSLSKVLNEPENAYGLRDSEFLLILRNLYDGMKYLRDNNLIHRDLKPDNVMKCILDDGSSIYKLTDFGAARELEEGEQFQSIHGTEEYLHPEMYERAFLTRNMKNFDSTIDLWSLGVTLYHTVTGILPFQPYGGRHNRDKTAMYKITSQKESGVISGIQKKEGGNVYYCKELPKQCLMSQHLKSLITPLLAGLMEADISKTWNFHQFFNEVDKIVSRKTIYVFHVSLITLYLPFGETYDAFQEIIMQTSGIEKLNQLIIFNNCILDIAHISDLPITTEEAPLFLFDKTNYQISICEEKNFSFIPFSNEKLPTDAEHCKLLCKIGYQHKREIDKYALCSKLIDTSVGSLMNYLNSELERVLQSAKYIREKIIILQIAANFVEVEDEGNINEIISSLQDYQLLSINNIWGNLSQDIDFSQMLSSKATVTTYVDLLCKSLKQFVKNKNTTLSYNEQKFYILEKVKVNDLLKKLQNLLNNEIYPVYKKIAQNFSTWYKTALTVINKIEILRNDIARFEQKVNKYQDKLKSLSNVQMHVNSKNNFEILYRNLQRILEEYGNKESCQHLIEEHYRLSQFLSRQLDTSLSCLLFDYKNLL